MCKMGMKAQWIKPWIATTKDSDFSDKLHNILNEQFNPERPNAVWCIDITYICTQDSFVYLNCVMNLFVRKIIAWTLADTMEVSTVIEIINKAMSTRNTGLSLNTLKPFIAQLEFTVIADICLRTNLKHCMRGQFSVYELSSQYFSF